MDYVLFCILGYLSGSVLYAYYLPLWLKGIDVTDGTPDGNPGAFNCIAKAGRPMGLFALVCDLLKGMLPVFLAARMLSIDRWGFALVLAAPVAGHAFPLFRKLRGGKAITVSFGVLLGLFPLWRPFALLAASYLFFSLILCIQPHRHRSIITFLCFAIGVCLRMPNTPVTLGCILVAGIVFSRHWSAREEEHLTARFLPAHRGRF